MTDAAQGQAARIARLQAGRNGSRPSAGGSSGKKKGRTPASGNRGRKRHPAKKARAVALLASFTATGGIGAAMAYSDREPGVETASTDLLGFETSVPTASESSTATIQSELELAVAADITVDGSLAAAPGNQYQDGSWLGTAEFTQWGDVQVQAIIEQGELVDVVVMQIPNDRKSASINGVAAPILEGQAVAIQGANLDIVSGATYTSRTYALSLQAALDQAQLDSGGVDEAGQAESADSGAAQEIALDS